MVESSALTLSRESRVFFFLVVLRFLVVRLFVAMGVTFAYSQSPSIAKLEQLKVLRNNRSAHAFSSKITLKNGPARVPGE